MLKFIIYKIKSKIILLYTPFFALNKGYNFACQIIIYIYLIIKWLIYL